MISQTIIDELIARGGRLKALAVRYQRSGEADRADAESRLRAALPAELSRRVRNADSGRLGGLCRSEAKAGAARDNGARGGRPQTIPVAARGKRLVKRRRKNA